MTEEQIENYIREDLGYEPKHDCRALSYPINDVAEELQHDSYDLMRLLLENEPINGLMTHSYGFHTRNGRFIIERIKENYYEYESTN